MKKYDVEMNINGMWDNIVGDYIEAENEEEAIDLAKTWCIENGMEPEQVEELDCRALDHDRM